MSKDQLELPIYLFNEGNNTQAYKLFSPHKEGREWIFRVWAPNASCVSLVGDFNGWNCDRDIATLIADGIWEMRSRECKEFDAYKFCITASNGVKVLKADPYAIHAETAPQNASKVYSLPNYKWKDKDWLERRAKSDTYSSPMNIYEVHLGSFKKFDDGNYFDYRKLAKELVPYVKNMGYTHIEIMPIMEHPYDGSWGYQVTGYFSATSRYGKPEDLMFFVDKCHREGIGVILDWVPAHFPKDIHGLFRFDGTRLYEVDDDMMCEHREWGTRIFDYGRNQVRSFLISSANFWLKEYHFDGIRVDAVASMLYLDYGRANGDYKPNEFGGNYNLKAIDFLKQLNKSVLTENKGAIMIAEESTAFPMVTKPTEVGGLGFNYKWNMGWMNDMLSYVSLNPFYRKDNHNKVTFSITYAYSENYILPLSHDEVVHGKCSLINKMPMDYNDKFEELKAFYGYMIGHPGKKLLFMGGEFGQFIEWDYKKGLDWLLLGYDKHKRLQSFVKDLNKYYLKHKEMYELDSSYDGFKWCVVDDNTQNIVSFVRYSSDGDFTLVIVNFSPVTRTKYEMGVPKNGKYKVLLDSASVKYGGSKTKSTKVKAMKGDRHGYENYIRLDIEGNSVMFLKCNDKKED